MKYEMAKIACQKWVDNEDIDRELAFLSKEEWEKQCTILDERLKKHTEKNLKNSQDVAEDILEELINFSNSINLDEVTVWVAYLNWLNIAC